MWTTEALGQPGWSGAPTPLSPVYSDIATYVPKVAMDEAGNARAIWLENSASFVGAVRTARYDAAGKVWSAAETLPDATAAFIAEPQVAVDGAGNAVASWTAAGAGTFQARAARYSATDAMWTPVLLAGAVTGRALVAANAAGDAVVVWNELAVAGFAPPVRLLARRYTAATGTWSSVDVLAPSLANTPQPGDVAIDGAGNIVVVWLGSSMVQATRFAAATGSWSDVANLSSPISNLAVPPPDVAMSPAGEALVSWARLTGIEAARWPAGGSAWAAPVSFPAMGADVARTAIDPAGNAVVAWTTTTSATARQLWAARYSADTATWSGPVALSSGALVLGSPSVAMDPQGNAFVLCSQLTPRPAPVTVFAARQAAATGTWMVSPNLSESAQDAYGPDVAVDAAGNAIVVWQQQLAGGLAATLARRWAATPPAPKVTAVSPGAGTLSVSFSLTPPMSATALEYSLDDGATWTPVGPAGATSPVAIAGLTDGVLQKLRLRGLNAAGAGEASDLVPVRSGIGSTPTDFRVVSRTGNTATFAWVAPVAGIVPDGYLIEGGLAGQTQVLASVPTAGVATQATLVVPNGVFFVRVVAQRGTIRIGQSADLQIAVNAGQFPSAPANLLGSAVGQRLTLSWVNTWNSAAPTGVRIDVSGSIATAIDRPVTEQFTFDGVPPGTYTFVVSPLVGAVPGDSSNVVTLTFPGACGGAPNPPAAFSATTQGGTAFLDWLPPASGAAVTGYVVTVAGSFTGAFPMASRTLAVAVPPGSYAIAVAATGPCGTSVATPAQTIVVQ